MGLDQIRRQCVPEETVPQASAPPAVLESVDPASSAAAAHGNAALAEHVLQSVPDPSIDLAAMESRAPQGPLEGIDWTEVERSAGAPPTRRRTGPDRGGPAPAREHVPLGDADLQSVDVGDGGVDVHLLDLGADTSDGGRVQGPRANVALGQLNHREREHDDRRWGVRADAGLGGTDLRSGELGSEVDTPSAAAEASIGEDGFTLGAQANVLSAGGTWRSEEGDELGGSVGLGAGAAFRGHWSDNDHDGVREIGLGADIGPFTFDARTEWFHRALQSLD